MNKKHIKTIIVLVLSFILVTVINIILYIDKPSGNNSYLIYSIILSVYLFCLIPSVIYGYKLLAKSLLEGLSTLGIILGVTFFIISSVIFAPYGMVRYYLNQFNYNII